MSTMLVPAIVTGSHHVHVAVPADLEPGEYRVEFIRAELTEEEIEAIEDEIDLAAIAARVDEPCIPYEQFVRELRDLP